MEAQKLRIGLYGGSFNPPHLGHLQIAEELKRLLKLDMMILIPAGNPYMKDTNEIAPKEDRQEMIERCVADASEELLSSTIELEKEGPSYTIDTLRFLHKRHPNAELYTVVGADAFSDMASWKEPEEIARLSTIVVVQREGYSSWKDPFIGYDRIGMLAQPVYDWWFNYTDKIMFVDLPILPISSTDIRSRIREGKAWHHLVSPGVVQYLEECNNPYEVKNV